MSLRQEITLLHGVGQSTAASGTVGATAPIPALGIPALNQQDGPEGVGDNVTGVTQLPAPEALAATFDPAAARCYGQVIGSEERGKGVNLVYGPTVNIVRVPQWGRTFESLGEDPVLTGDVAAAEVHGIQSTGTMAEVKHYAVYNQETYRNSPEDDSIVGSRALQEIYLRPWDKIVQADPAAVMCSYSTINGSPACQDRALLKGYLDGHLGFQGFVGSDYGATHSTVASANAGLDQEQPESTYFGQALLSAVRSGKVSRATINEAADRILTEMYRFGMFGHDTTGSIGDVVESPGDTRVATEVAEEGATLLKNTSDQLPLGASGGPVAVIGAAAETDPTSVGNGSATVTAPYVITPLNGIRTALHGVRQLTYAPGIPGISEFAPITGADLSPPFSSGDSTYSGVLKAPETGTYVFSFSEPADYTAVTLSINGSPLVANPGTPPVFSYTASASLVAGTRYRISLSGPAQDLSWALPTSVDHDISQAVTAARSASVAIVVVADDEESEAADRVSLTLPSSQDELIDAVAAANAHTVVVVDAGGPVAMPWLPRVRAVLDDWYPGQSDGTALAAVLFGKASPSGHLPITFPASLSATPVSDPRQFPGVNGKVHYSEGVDVGYRWYDATGHRPLFPFGFGLTYTTFSYTDPTAHVALVHGQPVVNASVEVSNTGSRAGADVAQLYLGEPPVANEPPRQLEAFERATLGPGASMKLDFTLRGLALAYYDSSRSSWRIAPGTYHVFIGDSSALPQLPARVNFSLSASSSVGPTAP